MSRLSLLVAGAFFMEFLDGTIVMTVLPSMAASFGSAAVDLHIGISAYLVTVAVFILPSSWVASRFGVRRVFTGAIAVFTVGSALCGLANSLEGFVAARVIQGVGGAMMVPVGRAIVLRTTEKCDLMRAIAVLTWPALIAPLLGPPLGGFIVEQLSWRWIFLINVPFGLVGMILSLRLLPRLGEAGYWPFDGRGFGLGAALLLCAMSAFGLLGRDSVPWPAIMALAAAACMSGLLLRRHVRRYPHPLLDTTPLQIRTFRMAMVSGTGMRVLINAMPFLLLLLFQLGFGLDPFQAGLLVLALFAGNVGMKPLTTSALRRWGFRSVLAGNGLVQAGTMLACAALTPATPAMALLALLVISGASRSVQFTALNTLAFADVPESSIAPASTLSSLAFQLSLGLGVVLGAVALRGAGHFLDDGASPSLASFQWVFGLLSVAMALIALAGLRLEKSAGSSVSGCLASGSMASQKCPKAYPQLSYLRR